MASTPDPTRTLVAVFTSPLTDYLLHFGGHLAFRTVLLDPDQDRLDRLTEAQLRYANVLATGPRADFLDGTADVVVTDGTRPELGGLLRGILDLPARWIGLAVPDPGVLPELDLPAGQAARIHHPSGLDVGAANPPELTVAILAQLLADRNGRPGNTSADLRGTGPAGTSTVGANA